MGELILLVGGAACAMALVFVSYRRYRTRKAARAWTALQNDLVWQMEWGPPPDVHYRCGTCDGIVDPITWDCRCTDPERLA